MWWIERFLRGRARARRRRIPFTSITDFPFSFFLCFGETSPRPWTLLTLVIIGPSRQNEAKGKKKGAPTKRHFFHFFHIFPNRSTNLPSSSSGQDRRRHVQARGKPLARRRTGEGRDEEEEEAFFRGWKRLEISWKPLVLSTEEGGVRLRCW